MVKWNYVSESKSSTGYEGLEGIFKKYSKEQYTNMNEEQREICKEEIFKAYREKNIFPIIYYNEEGIKKEIQKCVDKKVEIKNNLLDLKFNQGSSLCRFLFPNLLDVAVRGAENNTMLKRFYDDNKLKRAIDFSLRFKKHATPSEIRSSLELIGGGVATNFPPMKAKAIYEKYCPKDGTIFDFACGFGGRMLGALSSKNNYTYIGVEPCVETFQHLNELGGYVEEVTGRENSFKVYCEGSETHYQEPETIDFAFSSPPYFNLEKYSDADTQCYIKFPTLESWEEGYIRPTVANIFKMLKPNSYYAVNIADFKMGNNMVNFVDRWVEISKEEGFEFVETINMKLVTRKGVGHSGEKKEGIFVFKKNI